MELVTLGGKNSLEQVVAVARYGAKVEFSAEYRARVNACRAHVERFSREGKAIYGITTGLGDNCRKFIPEEDRVKIQRTIFWPIRFPWGSRSVRRGSGP